MTDPFCHSLCICQPVGVMDIQHYATCAALFTAHVSGPLPCAWFSHAPWMVVTPSTTATSLSHLICCAPGASPCTGKLRWFLGSYLVTGMGVGWLPNTFSLTGSLRTGFFAFAGARTFRTFAPVLSPTCARRLTVLLAFQTTYVSRGLVMSRLCQLPANPFHPF